MFRIEHSQLATKMHKKIKHSKKVFPGLLFFLVLLFPLRFYQEWLFFHSFSILDPVLVVGGLLLFFSSLMKGKIYIGDKGVFIILLFPFLFSILSILWTVDMLATGKSILVCGAAVVAYLMTVGLFKGLEIKKLHNLLIGFSIVLVGTAALSYFLGSTVAPDNAYSSSFDHDPGFLTSYYARFSHPFIGLSNSFATVLAMIIPLLMLKRRIANLSQITSVVIIFLVSSVLATGSRGVLLALIVVFGFVVFYRAIKYHTLPKWLTWGPFLVFLVTLIFFAGNPEALQFVGDRFEDRNVLARLDAYSSSLVILKSYPLGVGSGVSLRDVSGVDLQSTHNAYIQNLLWFGLIPGLLLSIVMLFLPIYVANISVTSKPAYFAKMNLSLSIIILMVINLTQASWEGSLLRVLIYSLVGFGVIMIKSADSAGHTLSNITNVIDNNYKY